MATVKRVNAACTAIAMAAFLYRTARQVKLHPLIYRLVPEPFGLAAQMAVRAIGKVAEAYKRDKGIQPTFSPHSAIVDDDRLLS
jgi:putative transposase